MKVSLRILLVFVAGALYSTGFEPFNVWPLTLCSIAVLFYTLTTTTTYKEAFLLSWLFGVGKYVVGVSWIYVSIHDHGDVHWLVSGGLVLGLSLIFALTVGLIGLLYRLVLRDTHKDSRFYKSFTLLCFATAWVLYEWVLTWIFGGFPWLLSGYVTTHTPLYGLAAVGGVALASATVVILASSALYLRNWRTVLALAGSIVVLALLSRIEWTSARQPYNVAAVQTATEISDKWDFSRLNKTFDEYALLSLDADVELVLWPESAVPVSVERNEQLIRSRIPQPLDRVYLIGQFDVQQQYDERRIYNSLTLFHDEARLIYRKEKLVPFGEYTPFADVLGPLFDLFQFPMSSLVAGTDEQPRLNLGDLNIVPSICFEIIFSSRVSQQTTATNGDLLVNVSEDAWFGNSIGPHQHFQVARMRAVEQGRYLLRAANKGITALVDPSGGVVAMLPPTESGIVAGTVHSMSGRTPFSYLPLDSGLLIAVVLLLSITVLRQYHGRFAQ